MPRSEGSRRPSRRPTEAAGHDSNLARHWKLLKQLTTTPKGYTIEELMEAAAVSDKTIRRDLVLLRKLGFDLVETVEGHGRKRWRVRQLAQDSRPNRQQYRSIQALLDTAIVQAAAIGDRRLAKTLTAARDRAGAPSRTGSVIESD